MIFVSPPSAHSDCGNGKMRGGAESRSGYKLPGRGRWVGLCNSGYNWDTAFYPQPQHFFKDIVVEASR